MNSRGEGTASFLKLCLVLYLIRDTLILITFLPWELTPLLSHKKESCGVKIQLVEKVGDFQ